jgi:hypothetical protein
MLVGSALLAQTACLPCMQGTHQFIIPLSWMAAGANVTCNDAVILGCGNAERDSHAAGDAHPQVVGALSAITAIGSEVDLSDCAITHCR